MKYISTKRFDGYSTVFRQWRATHSHCSKLHGYAISFKVWFEAESLDDKNWVQDFGSFKNNGVKEWLTNMFDHTLVVASDDPRMNQFQRLNRIMVADLRVVPRVGAESFAEMVFVKINEILQRDSNRVRVTKVECFENENNSAIFER